MYLANQIIALAKAEPRKVRRELDAMRMMFANATMGKATTDSQRALILHLLMAAERLTKDLPFLADHISQAMRFHIDSQITASVTKMRNTPKEMLLKAHKYARLPHPITWIEGGPDDTKVGWLLVEREQGKYVDIYGTTAVKNTAMVPWFIKDIHITVSEDGIAFPPGLLQKMPAEELDRQANQLMDAYRMILLINSKSRIFKALPPEAEDTLAQRKLNKKFSVGAAAFVKMQPIVIDTSRLIGKADATNRDMGEAKARELMCESIVTGHFKLRKTGLFWWSSFVRNPFGSTLEGLLANQERHVVSSLENS